MSHSRCETPYNPSNGPTRIWRNVGRTKVRLYTHTHTHVGIVLSLYYNRGSLSRRVHNIIITLILFHRRRRRRRR